MLRVLLLLLGALVALSHGFAAINITSYLFDGTAMSFATNNYVKMGVTVTYDALTSLENTKLFWLGDTVPFGTWDLPEVTNISATTRYYSGNSPANYSLQYRACVRLIWEPWILGPLGQPESPANNNVQLLYALNNTQTPYCPMGGASVNTSSTLTATAQQPVFGSVAVNQNCLVATFTVNPKYAKLNLTIAGLQLVTNPSNNKDGWYCLLRIRASAHAAVLPGPFSLSPTPVNAVVASQQLATLPFALQVLDTTTVQSFVVGFYNAVAPGSQIRASSLAWTTLIYL
jgi:hypothetical protein